MIETRRAEKNAPITVPYRRLNSTDLEDESGELVGHVQLEDVAASLAPRSDQTFLHADLEHGLRVLALLAENKP